MALVKEGVKGRWEAKERYRWQKMAQNEEMFVGQTDANITLLPSVQLKQIWHRTILNRISGQLLGQLQHVQHFRFPASDFIWFLTWVYFLYNYIFL